MSPIDSLPDLDWTDHARSEIVVVGPEIIMQSHVALQIGNVAIAGLIYHSFTSPPEMWFALARGVTMRDLIDFRRLQEYIPRGTTVSVKVGHRIAERFAMFYGFAPTETTFDFRDNSYRIYRRA